MLGNSVLLLLISSMANIIAWSQRKPRKLNLEEDTRWHNYYYWCQNPLPSCIGLYIKQVFILPYTLCGLGASSEVLVFGGNTEVYREKTSEQNITSLLRPLIGPVCWNDITGFHQCQIKQKQSHLYSLLDMKVFTESKSPTQSTYTRIIFSQQSVSCIVSCCLRLRWWNWRRKKNSFVKC